MTSTIWLELHIKFTNLLLYLFGVKLNVATKTRVYKDGTQMASKLESIK